MITGPARFQAAAAAPAAAAAAATITPHGAAIALAAILGAIGITFWAYGHMRRLSANLIAFAFGLVAIGVTVWSDALIGLASTGPGMTIFGVLAAVSSFAFYFEAVHHRERRMARRSRRAARKARKEARRARRSKDGQQQGAPGTGLATIGAAGALQPFRVPNGLDSAEHHHHIRTPVIAAVFGTTMALTIIAWSTVLTALLSLVSGTGRAIAEQSSSVHSGKAAGAMPHHQDGLIVLLGIAVFAIIIYLAHKIHKNRAETAEAMGTRQRGRAAMPPGSFPGAGVPGSFPAAGLPSGSGGSRQGQGRLR